MIARLGAHKHKLLAALAAIVLAWIGLGIREAVSADADLQQYNGSPSFFTDTTAAPTLLPRDGKRITADSNAVGSAPVNRSLKQIKDLVSGLHDATIGSRTGAVRRTYKALDVDGTGGNVSSLAAGTIRTATANDGSVMDPTFLTVFKIDPMGGETLLTKGSLAFINTADGGGNPARTSPVNNKVLPLNTAKAWVKIQTQMGVVNYADGYNITSCTVQSASEVYCDLAIIMDNTNYMPMATTAIGDYVECRAATTSRVECSFQGTQLCNGTAGCKLNLLVFGRQTT